MSSPPPTLAALAVVLLIAAGQPARGQETDPSTGPSALGTAAWIAGAEAVWVAGTEGLNVVSYHRGERPWRLRRVLDNVTDPWGAPVRDFECLPRDGCLPEEWSHYVTWTAMGALVRLRGHGAVESWLLSGLWGNWLWEYVAEGGIEPPQGHDLVINAGSSVLGVVLGGWLSGLGDGAGDTAAGESAVPDVPIRVGVRIPIG